MIIRRVLAVVLAMALAACGDVAATDTTAAPETEPTATAVETTATPATTSAPTATPETISEEEMEQITNDMLTSIEDCDKLQRELDRKNDDLAEDAADPDYMDDDQADRSEELVEIITDRMAELEC